MSSLLKYFIVPKISSGAILDLDRNWSGVTDEYEGQIGEGARNLYGYVVDPYEFVNGVPKYVEDVQNRILELVEGRKTSAAQVKHIFLKAPVSREQEKLGKFIVELEKNEGKDWDLENLTVHDLARLLRGFYSDLKVPLIERSKIPPLVIETGKALKKKEVFSGDALIALEKCVKRLGPGTKGFLKNLVVFVKRLGKSYNKTGMSTTWLSLLIGVEVIKELDDRPGVGMDIAYMEKKQISANVFRSIVEHEEWL